METFKTKSFIVGMTAEEVTTKYTSSSLLSFERAIEESKKLNGQNNDVAGYKITEQGIIILWNHTKTA